MTDLARIIKVAKRQGWTVIQSRRNCHWKFKSPNPRVPTIFTSSSPSDYRAIRNLTASLRRAGLQV